MLYDIDGKCVNDCGDRHYLRETHCVEKCNVDDKIDKYAEKLQDSLFKCADKCNLGAYSVVDGHLHCEEKCDVYFIRNSKTDNMQECVDKCNDTYSFLNVNECEENCGYYHVNTNGVKVCDDSCPSDKPYYF